MSVTEVRAPAPSGTAAPPERAVPRPVRASTGRPPARLTHARVLVPIDGSEVSLGAVRTARTLAAALGSELHTLTVAARTDDVGGLRAVAAAAVGSTVEDPRVAVRFDQDPGDAIVRRSIELDPALVVLGTRARGRVGRALFGSVTATVVNRGRPVIAVGQAAMDPTWSPQSRRWVAPLSGPVTAYVDGSSHDEVVLDRATGYARALGVPMTVLAVVTDAPAPLRPRGRNGGSVPAENVHGYVKALAAGPENGIDVTGTVQREPISVAGGIGSHLASAPGGLLVVGSRLEHKLPGVIRPATTAGIVRESPAPVLIVPVG